MSKVNDIVEARRKGFEKRFPLPDGCYLDDDGLYAGPCMPSFVNARFEAWCAALDSVCVELPDWFSPNDCGDRAYWADSVDRAIELSGIKVKP